MDYPQDIVTAASKQLDALEAFTAHAFGQHNQTLATHASANPCSTDAIVAC